MLVLERTVGEKIFIGDSIVITINEVKHSMTGSRVKIGVEAPRDVKVLRAELVRESPTPYKKGETYHAG